MVERRTRMSDYAISFRWNRVIQDRDWPKTQPARRAIMSVAYIISRYSDKDGSNIECSLNTISTKAGISRRTVIQVLDLLIQERLLMRDGKARGGVIRYRMIIGGSEQVLASTSSQPALCQNEQNSTTTNDAVRDSLTLAHTANKETTQPQDFTSLATSVIKSKPPQPNDPEILRSEIRTIYANRHIKNAMENFDAENDSDQVRFGFWFPQDVEKLVALSGDELVKRYEQEIYDFQYFTKELIEELLKRKEFKPVAKEHYCGLTELVSKQFRQLFREFQRTENEETYIAFCGSLTVKDCEHLLDDYFYLASEVICNKYSRHFTQLDPSRYEYEQELWHEGFEIGITIHPEYITLNTYLDDINRYQQNRIYA
jgi:hypothetical protein